MGQFNDFDSDSVTCANIFGPTDEELHAGFVYNYETSDDGTGMSIEEQWARTYSYCRFEKLNAGPYNLHAKLDESDSEVNLPCYPECLDPTDPTPLDWNEGGKCKRFGCKGCSACKTGNQAMIRRTRL